MPVAKPPVTFVPAHPSNFSKGRGGMAWEGLTIHTTDGGASIAALDSWFANPAAKASTHFGIGQDGTIHQYVSLDDTAFAHGVINQPTAPILAENPGVNPNQWLIGIEHLDGGTPGTITPAQFAASVKLAAWLFDAVILPGMATMVRIDRNHIIGHGEIDSVNRKFCPSWPAARFDDYIKQVQALVAGTPPKPVPVPDPRDARIRDLEAQAASQQALIDNLNGVVTDTVDQLTRLGGAYRAELEGIIRAADDDAMRAAVRRADALAKIAGLG